MTGKDGAGFAALEIRLHGRGGQGGVTCAKILAAVYGGLGKSVQSFGDYAGERSGAPVRAYTRVSDRPITNRNKVYRPDHLLVLDPTLIAEDIVAGLADGGVFLLNTTEPIEAFADRFDRLCVAVVDATAIARRHGIGTRTVVIVNTTIAGAFVRAVGLPLAALEEAYHHLGFASNLAAAKEAFESVRVREPVATTSRRAADAGAPGTLPGVLAVTEQVEGPPTGLATGNWRTQTPHYTKLLAPCNAFCPAGNDVVGFVQALARHGENEAAAVLGRSTPLASVCGRVCPAPCMDGCNRRDLDGSVNIRGLERWIADKVPVAAARPVPAATSHRFAIVGGGPAGIAAAYELALAGHEATIFEAERQLGGVLRTGIPTYRLPHEVLDREIEGVIRLGVVTRLGVQLDASAIEALAGEYDAVILATGLQKLRGLDGPPGGRSFAGVEQGIRFLHRVNVDGGAKLEGHVVVLGGGNTAMDCARSALRVGAAGVTVTYRRSRGEMPAIAEEVDHAEQEGVAFLFLRAPVGFVGEDRVSGVELAEVELGPADQSGRRRPILTDRRELLACDTVLLALGQSADLSGLPSGWELRDGRIHRAGLALNAFAAGDLSTGDGTVTHAIGDGRRTARRAMRALGVDVAPFERPDRSHAVPSTDIRFDHFARALPAHERLVPEGERARDFEEVNLGLEGPLESHRCFSCGDCTRCDTCLVYCPEGIIRRRDGAYDVDYAFCKGCGICVAECPRKAMEMTA